MADQNWRGGRGRGARPDRGRGGFPTPRPQFDHNQPPPRYNGGPPQNGRGGANGGPPPTRGRGPNNGASQASGEGLNAQMGRMALSGPGRGAARGGRGGRRTNEENREKVFPCSSC